MPAHLTPEVLAQLGQAGRVKGGQKPTKPEKPQIDPIVAAVVQQLTALSQRMAGLEDTKLKAVMAMAEQSEATSAEIVTALTKMLAQRPQAKAKEVWNFKVTERDREGRIVTVKAEQTQ